MLRKDMRPYDQSLFDNIVKGDFEKVAFRLMPQIESMENYTKSQYCRKAMQEEIRNLAEIIKAGNLEWRKQMDARWEATR
jgi:hypothetical protein